MKKFSHSFEQLAIARHLLYWTLLVLPVAVTSGSLVALFLWLLDRATAVRWQHLWLVAFLPLAGVLIVFLYNRWGKNAGAGNNLIMDEIHKPGGGVPARMGPLVLFSTILTHLFGGSAGREGTAVQMGGAISALFSRWYRLKHADKRILLLCGMSAGFGAVFGTPVAGTVFALEVLAIGRIRYEALVPCFMAALLADATCSLWGIHHTKYSIAFTGAPHLLPSVSFDPILLLQVAAAGAVFGLAGFFFAELSHWIKSVSARYIPAWWGVPVVGAAAVLGISYALGTFDYLGLGVSHPAGGVSILSAFETGGADTWSWLWKLLLTAITLGTGFRGGEVTPLFFIGATLGHTLAVQTGAPVDLFAGLGFLAVFSGATNTPLACTLMGVELFGGANVVYFAVACFTAYYFSGHSGIYTAQRIAVDKFHRTRAGDLRLNEIKTDRKEGAGGEEIP